jgi:serine/threonine-protein kinase
VTRRVLSGYELEHRLGEGASSTVWRASQVSALGRPVAVKRVRLHGGRPVDGDAADQLRTEAEVLVTLDHPHIIRVLEVVPEADGDGVAIVMQLAPGGSLDERLGRRGRIGAEETTAIVTKLAGALASAHRRGVLHRDVKPANVLFTSDGEPLLSDFGIAAWAGAVGADPVRGTEVYLDPTVPAGRPADATSDLYALGAVAFEMLTGEPPPPEGAGLPAEVPEPLAASIVRCLAADPADRFPSAAALLDALRGNGKAAVAPTPVEGPAVVIAFPRPARETRVFGPRPPAPATTEATRSWTRAAAAAAGLVLVVAGSWAGLRAPADRPRQQPVALAANAVSATTASCPPVAADASSLVGDLDGDGCDESVRRVGNVLERDGERFALGDAGDVPVLGDWDCDGIDTPGVFRPSTGAAHLFDGWAPAGQPLPAARAIEVATPPSTPATCGT